ncbi:MAG TPA: hypothetical protein VE987_04215, partial [Polyangiaceae bacterium]|nr:hypothetical protein [Polyangiaceae bacterium]
MRVPPAGSLAFAALTAVLLSRCGGSSSSSPASACTPGQSIRCAGPSGCTGYQVCKQDGTGFAPCACGGSGSGFGMGFPGTPDGGNAGGDAFGDDDGGGAGDAATAPLPDGTLSTGADGAGPDGS